ncbi:MAG: TetR/AcrR family transcriptional regulator [Gemmatimonadales bacterium]
MATAARVFAEQGFHATSMRDLAGATGMSLAGMYHYVSGKDELLYQIQERCFSSVIRDAQTQICGASDPTERLVRFIVHHVTYFAEHMSEMKVLSHEAESLAPRHRSKIERLKRRYVDLLLKLIEETDTLAPPLDARVATYALFGMMNWIYTWYDPAGAVTPNDLADQMATLFLHGIQTATPSSQSYGG